MHASLMPALNLSLLCAVAVLSRGGCMAWLEQKAPCARPTLQDLVSLYGDTSSTCWPMDRSEAAAAAALPEPEAATAPDNKAEFSERIHMALVVCGPERVEESVTLVKSAALLTAQDAHLTFHIFADEPNIHTLRAIFSEWPARVRRRLTVDLRPVDFPTQDRTTWETYFKKCASQRLFIPVLLKQVDAVIYTDTDVVWMTPPSDLWGKWRRLNASQLAGLAPEHEDPAISWYKRFALHPYYGPLGVNSGVMLMNLTRMREGDWLPKMLEYFKIYRLNTTWGDQDLINIYFHFFPERLWVFGCEYNYRPDHCMYMSTCHQAEARGVFLLHGNRRSFDNDKQPAFRALYRAWAKQGMEEDLKTLTARMSKYLSEAPPSQCGTLKAAFLKEITRTVNELAKDQ